MRTTVGWQMRRIANVNYHNGQSAQYVDEIVDFTAAEVSDITDALAETQRDKLMDKFLRLLRDVP